MNTITPLIAAVEKAANSSELVQSVQALADSRSMDAIPALIAALGYNNPSAAIAAMHGLVSIGCSAVPALISLMDNYNYGARAYTVRALAMIGDPRSLEILIKCAETDFAPSVRRAAIKGLGYLRWDWADWDENTISVAQARISRALQLMLDDTDWSMRYAAVVALDAIAATNRDTSNKAIALLGTVLKSDPDLAVRFRVQMALGRTLVVAS